MLITYSVIETSHFSGLDVQ